MSAIYKYFAVVTMKTAGLIMELIGVTAIVVHMTRSVEYSDLNRDER